MNRLIFFPAVALCLAACTSAVSLDQEDGDVSAMTITQVRYVPESGTKSTIVIENSVKSTYWDDDDEVGIFPDLGGYQLGFSLQGQGGKTTAAFDGGGWALRSDARYTCYYPFDFDNKDLNSIPIDYSGQVQDGENSTMHLGAYNFAASDPTGATDGKVSFTLNPVGTLVWIQLILPVATTYTELALVTDSDLFTIAGTYSLAEGSGLAVSPTRQSNAVTLGLGNFTTTAANQQVNAYMMVAPTDLTGHEYKVYAKAQNGTYYFLDLADKNHIFRKGAFKLIAPTSPLAEVDGDVPFSFSATGEAAETEDW